MLCHLKASLALIILITHSKIYLASLPYNVQGNLTRRYFVQVLQQLGQCVEVIYKATSNLPSSINRSLKTSQYAF